MRILKDWSYLRVQAPESIPLRAIHDDRLATDGCSTAAHAPTAQGASPDQATGLRDALRPLAAVGEWQP